METTTDREVTWDDVKRWCWREATTPRSSCLGILVWFVLLSVLTQIGERVIRWAL